MLPTVVENLAKILRINTFLFVALCATAAAQAMEKNPPQGDSDARDQSAERHNEPAPDDDDRYFSPHDDGAPHPGYYDEPPLDWPERRWRWYTRHVTPQRFARRDRSTRYGYNPPFAPYTRYGANSRYGDGPYGGYWGYDYDPADSYVQGRYDERRFQEWREHNDRTRDAYADAMSLGLERFQEARYSESLAAFTLAAEVNQGDPASRLHATYALVAIGNYKEATLMLRRAIQLQGRLLYLPLSIREEYGRMRDFETHLDGLWKAANNADDDPGIWMLLGFYEHFSGGAANAFEAVEYARKLAPRDRLIDEVHRAVRLLTPTRAKPRDAKLPRHDY